MKISEYLTNNKIQLTRFSYLIFLNLSIIFLILIILNKLTSFTTNIIAGTNWFFSFLILSLLISIISKYNLNKKRNKENQFLDSLFEVSPYFFVGILIILAINQFLKFQFLTNYNIILLILCIGFGLLTFYKNRIEEYEEKEELQDFMSQRVNDFEFKFPRIARIPIIKNIFKEIYELGWPYTSIIAIIVIINIIIRIWYDLTNYISFEKGLILYDSSLLFSGLLPIRDFLAREPLNLIFYSIFYKLFNINYIESISAVIFILISAFFLLLFLKRNSFNKNLILLTFIIYFLSPFGLFFVNYQLTALLLINLYIFSTIYAGETKISKYLLLSISILAATYIYRGMALLFLIEPLFLYIYTNKGPNKFKELISFYIPVFLLLYIPIIIYSCIGNFSTLVISLNVDKIILISIIPLLIFIFNRFKIKKIGEEVIISTMILVALIGFFTIKKNDLIIKIAAIAQFYRYSAGAFALGLLGVYAWTKSIISKNIRVNLTILSLLISIVFLVVGLGAESRGPALKLSLPYHLLLTLGVFIIVYLLFYEYKKKVVNPISNIMNLSIISIITIFIGQIIYGEWLYSYLNNYYIYLTLIGALFLYNFIKTEKKKRFLLISFTILLTLSSLFLVLNERQEINSSIEINTQSANEVIYFIKNNITENQTLLTTTPWFILMSNHSNSIRITHPIVYLDRRNNALFDNIINDTEILELINGNKIDYIIVDKRFKDIFLNANYPEINNSISKKYRLSKYIPKDDIKILSRQ